MGKHTDWWKQAFFKGFAAASFGVFVDLLGIGVMIWRGDGAGGANIIGMIFALAITAWAARACYRMWRGKPVGIFDTLTSRQHHSGQGFGP